MSLAIHRLKRELFAIVALVPAGRVVTHATLAARWNVPAQFIASVMAGLDEAERRGIPWHRVVAAGGAVGRHLWRDQQIALLKAEGVPVAPAGIVHELAMRAIRNLDAPGETMAPSEFHRAPSRSRGMKSASTSPRKGRGD